MKSEEFTVLSTIIRQRSPHVSSEKAAPHPPHSGPPVTAIGRLAEQRYDSVLGLTTGCAALSFLLCAFAIFWLLRIKRNFRHDLILRLIIANTIKSVAYTLVPIRIWSGHVVSDGDRFCLITGWLLSLAIEAVDFLILVIAIHTLLYVFQHSKKPGQGGLYRHRRLIYILWICLPVFLASIAFVNDDDPYVLLGTACYLPRRPLWYRLTLAWGPRYLIILFILVSYAAIYIYAGRTFRSIAKDLENRTGFPPEGRREGPRRRSTLENVQCFLAFGGKEKAMIDRRLSIPLPHGGGPDGMNFITTASIAQPPEYESLSFITISTVAQEEQLEQSLGDVPMIPLPRPIFSPQYMAASSVTQLSDYRAPAEWHSTPPSITVVDWHNTTKANEACTRWRSSLPLRRRKSTDPRANLQIKRMAIRKQLRYLFIYPIVYTLLWIFPLASHVMQYDDYLATHQPFWIWILSAASLSLQAGADAFILVWRERPWRRKRAPLPGWWMNFCETVRFRANSSRGIKKEDDKVLGHTKERLGSAVNWWEKHEEGVHVRK